MYAYLIQSAQAEVAILFYNETLNNLSWVIYLWITPSGVLISLLPLKSKISTMCNIYIKVLEYCKQIVWTGGGGGPKYYCIFLGGIFKVQTKNKKLCFISKLKLGLLQKEQTLNRHINSDIFIA